MKKEILIVFLVILVVGVIIYLDKGCNIEELSKDMPSSFNYSNVVSEINKADEKGMYVGDGLIGLAEYYCIDTSNLKTLEDIGK